MSTQGSVRLIDVDITFTKTLDEFFEVRIPAGAIIDAEIQTEGELAGVFTLTTMVHGADADPDLWDHRRIWLHSSRTGWPEDEAFIGIIKGAFERWIVTEERT